MRLADEKWEKLLGSTKAATQAIKETFPAFVGDRVADFKAMLTRNDADAEKLMAMPLNKWPEEYQQYAKLHLQSKCTY